MLNTTISPEAVLCQEEHRFLGFMPVLEMSAKLFRKSDTGRIIFRDWFITVYLIFYLYY